MPECGTYAGYTRGACRCDACSSAAKVYREAWKARNPDYWHEWWAARYAADPEGQREKSAEWRRANPEKKAAYHRRYAAANRSRMATYQKLREARKRGATGECTPDQLAARIAFYGERCYCCAAPYEAIDHVIPVSKGGSNWPANLRPICTSCNSRKRDKVLKYA